MRRAGGGAAPLALSLSWGVQALNGNVRRAATRSTETISLYSRLIGHVTVSVTDPVGSCSWVEIYCRRESNSAGTELASRLIRAECRRAYTPRSLSKPNTHPIVVCEVALLIVPHVDRPPRAISEILRV